MKELQILGGSALTGDIRVQGAKNAVLPILAATILAGGQVELRGCPHLKDVEASIRILEALGCTAWWEGNSLLVDTTTLTAHTISEELMRQMRSSAIFLGAILGRCGAAEMSYPGGCDALWDAWAAAAPGISFFLQVKIKIFLFCY
ncbi:MAG: UDP-N-acetylglucosamine 1-carboxyvinyltransferase [Oscillibacter sp.]|jgi:UDP-N-acetylglucosamine 1-carboxyvinyltransferase|nr:UDP-N-acetylglucosamine 1-carboxyvinyltransferase [Oscillibacter sp.]